MLRGLLGALPDRAHRACCTLPDSQHAKWARCSGVIDHISALAQVGSPVQAGMSKTDKAKCKGRQVTQYGKLPFWRTECLTYPSGSSSTTVGGYGKAQLWSAGDSLKLASDLRSSESSARHDQGAMHLAGISYSSAPVGLNELVVLE
jgi:hypothetical protein